MRRPPGSIAGKALLLLLFFFILALAIDGLGRVVSADPGGIANHVVVNEVAWMGTQAFAVDEWLELKNNTDQDIDLTGWTLEAADGTPSINLSGIISGSGFYLLERTDDTTVSDIPADQIYTGALGDGGEILTLKDATGNVIDTANGDGGAWPAGDKDTRSSMERVDPTAPDSDGNWGTNDGVTRNGLDANGNAINGTPKADNSVTTVSGPPYSPSTVTVTAAPTTIPADGSSTSIITATVVDTYTNPVANGTVVTFTTNLGTFPSDSYTNTTTSGVATATLTSDIKAGTATITATSDSISDTTTVEFVPGSPFTVTVMADPTSITADGVSSSTITATVVDQHTNPVTDTTVVTFTTSLGSLASDSITKTTVSGVATATLTSDIKAGTATITATADSVSGTTTVNFRALPVPVGGVTYPVEGGPVPCLSWAPVQGMGLAALVLALFGGAFLLSRSRDDEP